MLQRAVFIACACLLLASAAAIADEKEEAKKHFDNGLALLKAENFEAAAVEFETAVKLYPTKSGMFNLANCYKTLQRYDEALNTLALLRGEFGAALDDEYEDTVAALEAEINALVAQLSIEASEDGATLLMDGEQVGVSPLPKPLLVGPGVHDLEATLEGFKPAKRKVKLASGDDLTVQLVLEKEAPAAGARVGSDDDGLSPLFWIGLGGTVAAGAVAGVFWGMRAGALDDYDKYKEQYDAAPEHDAVLFNKVEDARDDSIKFKRAAIGTTVAAGAFAAATVVVLIVELAGDGDEREEAAVNVFPAPAGVAVTF